MAFPLPLELSVRFCEFLCSWRQRAVSKRWNLCIISKRLEALEQSSVLDQLQVSPSYFEGDTDFLARRLFLGRCDSKWSGKAEAIWFRGCLGQALERLGRKVRASGYTHGTHVILYSLYSYMKRRMNRSNQFIYTVSFFCTISSYTITVNIMLRALVDNMYCIGSPGEI